MRGKFIALATMSAALLLGPAPAQATTSSPAPAVSQNQVLKVTPAILAFDAMPVEVERTKTLVVKNVSQRTALITPYLNLGDEQRKHLTVHIFDCHEKCIEVEPQAVFKLAAGSSMEFDIRVVLKKTAPQGLFVELSGESKPGVAANFRVRGELAADGTNQRTVIVPQGLGDPVADSAPARPLTDMLPALGSNPVWMLATSAVFIAGGLWIFALARRRTKDR